MVEVVTAALEDQLVDPLSFRLTKQRHILQKEEVAHSIHKAVIFIIQQLEPNL